MAREKLVKNICARTDDLLEEVVNEFFAANGTCWRLVCVTAGSGYRTAWLEFDPS